MTRVDQEQDDVDEPLPDDLSGSSFIDPYFRPSLRPCKWIEPDGMDGSRFQLGLGDVYGALTDELPLAGAEALRCTPDGGIAIVEHLRAHLPWMEVAIGLIERQLKVAVWAGRPWIQFRPVCLVGPPGVGKSHMARELSRRSGAGHATLDLGAMSDAAALVAVSRGWSNAKPCWPAQMMAAHRCANVMLTLDEIDKTGGSRRNGDPLTALLGMLERSTASAYFDTCLMAEVDLSEVCWIFTANDADLIPRPLAARMDVVVVDRPEAEHFDGLMVDLLVGMAGRWKVPVTQMPEVPARAVRVLRQGFARHRSVRLLGRHLHDVVALLVAGPRENLQ